MPTSFTVQHVDPRVAIGLDRRSLTAPKRVTLYAITDLGAFRAGFREGLFKDGNVRGALPIVDGEFDPSQGPLQTFAADKEALEAFKAAKPDRAAVKVVSFRIESNWGYPEYTCVYRVRVHGKEVSKRVMSSNSN